MFQLKILFRKNLIFKFDFKYWFKVIDDFLINSFLMGLIWREKIFLEEFLISIFDIDYWY